MEVFFISHDKIYSDFGQRLSFLRQEKRLSQNKLAKMLDMPQSTYAGYETGKRKINLELIEQFSSFFNISPTVLIASDPSLINDEEKFSAHEHKLIKKYRALTPIGKKTVDLILDNQYEQVKTKSKM